MNSHEAMQRMISRKTREFARRMGLSDSTIGKWQEPHLHPDDSGTNSPLDRLEHMIEISLALGIPREDALAAVHYLIQRFMLPTESNLKKDFTTEFFSSIKEFSHLSSAASSALIDGKITPK